MARMDGNQMGRNCSQGIMPIQDFGLLAALSSGRRASKNRAAFGLSTAQNPLVKTEPELFLIK